MEGRKMKPTPTINWTQEIKGEWFTALNGRISVMLDEETRQWVLHIADTKMGLINFETDAG